MEYLYFAKDVLIKIKNFVSISPKKCNLIEVNPGMNIHSLISQSNREKVIKTTTNFPLSSQWGKPNQEFQGSISVLAFSLSYIKNLPKLQLQKTKKNLKKTPSCWFGVEYLLENWCTMLLLRVEDSSMEPCRATGLVRNESNDPGRPCKRCEVSLLLNVFDIVKMTY